MYSVQRYTQESDNPNGRICLQQGNVTPDGRKARGGFRRHLRIERRRHSGMELMEMILSDENLEEAIRRVKRNRGAAGVDGMKDK